MLGSKLDILKREWIDVVFNGRNQAYGAYQLRKNNASNTNKSLLYGAIFFIFVISLPTIINKIQGFIPKEKPKVKITDIVLTPPPPDPKKPPPPPPEPPKPKTSQVKFPPPIVKPDNEVKEEPPTQKELKVADPGQKDIKGDPNADVVINEPVGNSEVKAVTEDVNKIYESVENEPEYPGGIDGFYKYLVKVMRYPAVDRENNVTGKVFVQFVVETDGSLTQVKAVRGPSQTLMDEAIRSVKSSPHWKPGVQNGRKVRVQYTVPVNFTLSGSDN